NAFIVPFIFVLPYEFIVVALSACLLNSYFLKVKRQTVALAALAAGYIVLCLTISMFGSLQFWNMGLLVLASLFVIAIQPKVLFFAALLMLPTNYLLSSETSVKEYGRNFFGIVQVIDIPFNQFVLRYLNSGSTAHGIEQISPKIDLVPSTYYSPSGPIGDVIQLERPANVGVIGLGAGTLACHMAPDRHFTFYEINPLMPKLASWFYYFKHCGMPAIKIGDGRKLLEQAVDTRHDVLVVDAFTSDAIPVHLITKEAMQLYADRISPNGVIALHVTNRYYSLPQVAFAAAKAAGLKPYYKLFVPSDSEITAMPSLWVIAIKPEKSEKPYIKRGWGDRLTREISTWTDDYSNPLSALSWELIYLELKNVNQR
ncbi:MAG: fused MFS/spermidine synthase, partial [Alphaproteobacteria bacterium]